MGIQKVCKSCKYYVFVGKEFPTGDNYGACRHPSPDIPSYKPSVRACKGWEAIEPAKEAP